MLSIKHSMNALFVNNLFIVIIYKQECHMTLTYTFAAVFFFRIRIYTQFAADLALL